MGDAWLLMVGRANGDADSTRRLSEAYLTGYQLLPRDTPGVFSLLRGLRPLAMPMAMRTGRTHGPCVPTAGVKEARAVRAEAWAIRTGRTLGRGVPTAGGGDNSYNSYNSYTLYKVNILYMVV